MPLTVTIGAAVVLVIFALAGALRDLPRGILALAGVLLGAALVGFWAGPLAADLGQRLGNPDRALLRRSTSILIFSVATLLGFGSGLLIPKATKAKAATRLAGAVLGVFSGALALGYLLAYAGQENPTFLAEVRASPVGGPLHDQLPLVLAGGAALLGIAVIGRMLLGLFAGRTPTPSAGQPAANTQPVANTTTTAQRAAQQNALDKINDRLKP